MTTPESEGAGCFVVIFIAVLFIYFFSLTTTYFKLQDRALNACPTAGVRHIAYHINYWFPLSDGQSATVTCGDGEIVVKVRN